MTLYTIEGGKGKVDAEEHAILVAELRGLLDRLEAGERVKSYAVAVTLADGCIATQHGGEDLFAMLGTLRWLEQRLLDRAEDL